MPMSSRTLNNLGTSDPVALDATSLLKSIGFEPLADKSFQSFEALTFVTLEALIASGVPAGHAGRLFERLKFVLASPPVTDGPVRVYVSCTTPPILRDMNSDRMTCNVRMKFDAIWCDPRLKASTAIRAGDPVLAPHCWKPQFAIPGSTVACKMTRIVYHDPSSGYVRATFRSEGELNLAADESTTAQGIMTLRIRLQVLHDPMDTVELWHPRAHDGLGKETPSAQPVEDGWDRLTNASHPKYTSPDMYTDKYIFVPEFRLCSRDQEDAEVGIEVLTSSYLKELQEDIDVMRASEEGASIDSHGLFLRHVLRKHLNTGEVETHEDKVECLANMLDELTQAGGDDGLDSFDETSGCAKNVSTRLHLQHSPHEDTTFEQRTSLNLLAGPSRCSRTVMLRMAGALLRWTVSFSPHFR